MWVKEIGNCACIQCRCRHHHQCQKCCGTASGLVYIRVMHSYLDLTAANHNPVTSRLGTVAPTNVVATRFPPHTHRTEQNCKSARAPSAIHALMMHTEKFRFRLFFALLLSLGVPIGTCVCVCVCDGAAHADAISVAHMQAMPIRRAGTEGRQKTTDNGEQSIRPSCSSV